MSDAFSDIPIPALKPQVKRMAFIPARGGSKGVFRKNVRDLCGQPLIAYTIKAALACGGFDRVVVSTDDEEVAELSREYGAYVPCLRPAEFSGDKAPLSQALAHMQEVLKAEGETFHVCAELFPTSPFRTPRMLRFFLSKLEEGYQSVCAVSDYPLSDIRFHTKAEQEGQCSVDTWACPVQHGIFCLGLFKGYWLAGKPNSWGTYLHPVNDPAERVDIDTESDFELARYVLENDLYDLGL